MTPEAFRKLALSLPEAIESSHFGTPDFRVGDKIFATAGRMDGRSVLKLTADQQQMLCEAEPAMFAPVAGAWGRKGWTNLVLRKGQCGDREKRALDGVAQHGAEEAPQGASRMSAVKAIKPQPDVDALLSALADPARRRAIEYLSEAPRRAGELAGLLGLPAPAMSRHLKALKSSDLIAETHPEFDQRVRVYALNTATPRRAEGLARQSRARLERPARRLRQARRGATEKNPARKKSR